MSKKLLMNNYSENGLMPVMDGLICWLDGRDGKPGDTVWKDRSGNGNDAKITGCEWTGCSLRINTNSDQFLAIKDLINNKNDPYTLEIYFKRNRTTGGTENIMMANATKEWYASTSIYINDDRMFCDVGNITLTNNLKNNTAYQVAIMKSNTVNRKAFLNSEFVTDIVTGDNIHGISFLGNWDDTKMKGDYYSIRVYNCVLTEEEIQQNYLYEQSIERGE